jgi:hypothetical protein
VVVVHDYYLFLQSSHGVQNIGEIIFPFTWFESGPWDYFALFILVSIEAQALALAGGLLPSSAVSKYLVEGLSFKGAGTTLSVLAVSRSHRRNGKMILEEHESNMAQSASNAQVG